MTLYVCMRYVCKMVLVAANVCDEWQNREMHGTGMSTQYIVDVNFVLRYVTQSMLPLQYENRHRFQLGSTAHA